MLTLEKYRELFGYTVHPFTGVDYVAYYMDLIRDCGAETEVIFANDAKAILPYTKNVINCDIHTRKRTKRRLIAAGAEKVFSWTRSSPPLSTAAAITRTTACWAPTRPPRIR